MEENKKVLQDNFLLVDIYSILRALLKDWWMILTAGLIGGMLAYVLAKSAYVPSYTSSMTFIVSAKDSTSGIANLTAANEMAETFGEVLNSRLLKKKVQQELKLDYLPGEISTTVVDETNLMTLRVSAPSPEHAFKIMKSVLNNYSEITDYVLSNVVLDVLEAPQVPMAPSNPISIRSMVAKYALFGVVLMIAFLTLLDYFRDDIKNEQEVELKLDTKLFGTIYHEKKNKTLRAKLRRKKKGLLMTNPTSSFLFVENYKKIRTKLVYKTGQENGKVILVTSVLENEGKSTVAANIALAFAQKAKKVILMDGDLRRPAIHKILERKLDNKQEIGEFLSHKISVNEVLHYDREFGIYLMIGSKRYSNSTELLADERMRSLIQIVRQKADYVIIDSPPTSLMADAEILAEYADVSLLVVRQGMASAGSINDTIDMLEGGQSKLLGCIYNDVKTGVFSSKSPFKGYGYGRHRYGYGGYGKYGKVSRQEYKKADSKLPVEELELHEEQV